MAIGNLKIGADGTSCPDKEIPVSCPNPVAYFARKWLKRARIFRIGKISCVTKKDRYLNYSLILSSTKG
jgi:hypothetical protein